MIEEFKLNQQIQVRKDKYIELTTYRLNRWLSFMEENYNVTAVALYLVMISLMVKIFMINLKLK